MIGTLLRVEALPESGPGAHRVVLRRPDQPVLIANFAVNMTVSGQQHEDLRWYLEEYAQYPQDPAPLSARRVEAWMSEAGARLFNQTFGSDEGQSVWSALAPHLAETRVELSGVSQPVMWLQTRHPQSSIPIALQVRSFVHTSGHPGSDAVDPARPEDPFVRVLIVICRPRRNADVPFRSVAAQLLMNLEPHLRKRLRLDVLRPPTIERLRQVLTEAVERGEPYHAVHFDGHGVFEDPFGTGRPRGYVIFENQDSPENQQYVHGALLGRALKAGAVPILLLNACRSARSELHVEPETSNADGDEARDRTKAYGSLAEEVVKTGVPGVVAMGFNVYVVTAARFMADLYQALAQGRHLGEAVTVGRRNLFEDPRRTILQEPVELQDWVTPLVHEANPIRVCSPSQSEIPDLPNGQEAPPFQSMNVPGPEAGFIGMDDALLSIDRGFDRHSMVMLHGYAGAGKTSTAVEFASWYRTTGGLAGGPTLFTPFDHHADLARILDRVIEPVFGNALMQRGRNWLTLTPAERRQATLDLFKETPVLWIWDNVEAVAGFPNPSDALWSDHERRELLDFLQEAGDTKARFLFTSRREENQWLGNSPIRVRIPPLPMLERFQMALSLARRYGQRSLDAAAWRPLIEFTGGNPLTLLVLVKQAMREGLTTLASVEELLERVRTGAAGMDDDETQGRSASLGASLRFGFENAFTNEERMFLSLLHMFRDATGSQMLTAMSDRRFPWHLADLMELHEDAAEELLDRAAAIGLLSPAGRGWYTIHPALPWFFSQLFQTLHGHATDPGSEGHVRDCRLAYCSVVGLFGSKMHSHYNRGDRRVIGLMRLHEQNLLHARRLCLDESAGSDATGERGPWHDPLFGCMDALRVLLEDTGRWAHWWHLVEEVVPRFLDPATNTPLPGRERFWRTINSYRHRLATQRRQWPEAERLQRESLSAARKDVAALIRERPEALTADQRDDMERLSVVLQKLANTLLETQDAGCVPLYEEAMAILERIARTQQGGGAECAVNLGTAYKNLEPVRNLEKAEFWYQRSLQLRDPGDRMGAGETLMQLGNLYTERFQEAVGRRTADPEVQHYFQTAAQAYQRALALLPQEAWSPRGAAHMALGFLAAGSSYEQSMKHYREAIRCFESDQDFLRAGMVRCTVALVLLMMAKRPGDALEYAEAAVRAFQIADNDAAREETVKARKLIEDIRAVLVQGPAGSG